MQCMEVGSGRRREAVLMENTHEEDQTVNEGYIREEGVSFAS